MSRRYLHLAAIFLITALTTYLHFATMHRFSPHIVFEELYYLPLLLGVLRFGLQGAFAVYLFVSAAYLPFYFPPWSTTFQEYADRTLHLALTAIIAATVGFLVERERKNRFLAEKERYLAAIGRVATVIVHDLKNPLIAILGLPGASRKGRATRSRRRRR